MTAPSGPQGGPFYGFEPGEDGLTERQEPVSLRELEGRQRAIEAELRKVSALDEPSDEDIRWIDTLITEWDSNEVLLRPVRDRERAVRRILGSPPHPPTLRRLGFEDDLDENLEE